MRNLLERCVNFVLGGNWSKAPLDGGWLNSHVIATCLGDSES